MGVHSLDTAPAQLLARAGHSPPLWHPSGHPVGHTARAQCAATAGRQLPLALPSTPTSCALWATGQPNTIARGAVMRFENVHGMTADGEAGPAVWRKLFDDAINHRRLHERYSYVYVHRSLPQTVTLWHAGHTILSSPANTGISGAETALGTYPVFEHIPEGTMSGTNPDGSHYNDPGFKWISYFNGGDAPHNFERASFGTPRVRLRELPPAASARPGPSPRRTLVRRSLRRRARPPRSDWLPAVGGVWRSVGSLSVRWRLVHEPKRSLAARGQRNALSPQGKLIE
jgi:hypothetical protein